MTTRISQVDKSVVLLTVPNPNYEEPIHKYSHLHGEVMDDNDKKATSVYRERLYQEITKMNKKGKS